MEKNIYPDITYSHLSDNYYLTSLGEIVSIYKLVTPAIYSLTPIDFRTIFSTLNSSFLTFKEDKLTIHKQDLFIRKKYDVDNLSGDSFLSESKKNRFIDTDVVEHECFISFNIGGLQSLEKAYITNPLKFELSLHVNDNRVFSNFKKKIVAVVAQINEIANFRLESLDYNSLQIYLYNYRTLFSDNNIVKDYWTEKDYLTDKRKYVSAYVLSDESQLPDEITIYGKDRIFKQPSETNESNELDFLQTMYCENLGITFKKTHIINQIWKFDPKYIIDFEKIVSKTKRYKGFSKDLQLDAERKEKQLEDVKKGNHLLCSFHYNILLIEDKEKFEESKEELETMINRILPKVYMPTGEGLINVYLSSILGYEKKLHNTFSFVTNIDATLALSVYGSNEKQSSKGTIFCDRNTNAPLFVDLWDKPFGETIKARNGIIISSTGGGKSVLALNIIRQHIESGIKVIVLEIGRSFELLTNIYKDNSTHIRYNSDTNIGFNPFKIKNIQPTSEEIDQVVDLVERFLQHPDKTRDARAEEKTLEKVIIKYYQDVKENHSFDSFFTYVESNKSEIEVVVNKKYFDCDRFLLVCKDFCKGGRYEKLCVEGDNSFLDKDLIVIELSDIKNNQFLFGYFMYILTLLMDNILMNRGVKGLLFLDEYGETSNQKATDNFDIHQTVAYCYQKLRKENSACYIAIQHAEQLQNNNYTTTIFTQTDLLFVPQTGRDIYEQIIKATSIKSEKTKNLMFSMNSQFNKETVLSDIENQFSEILILVSKTHPHVVRICLSKEEYLCYQTEGDVNTYILNEVKQGTEIKEVINNIINNEENIYQKLIAKKDNLIQNL